MKKKTCASDSASTRSRAPLTYTALCPGHTVLLASIPGELRQERKRDHRTRRETERERERRESFTTTLERKKEREPEREREGPSPPGEKEKERARERDLHHNHGERERERACYKLRDMYFEMLRDSKLANFTCFVQECFRWL